MQLMDVINQRRTIRDFADTNVSMETIMKALKAGLKAPTYNHMRQWDFILVKDLEKRMELVEAENLNNINDLANLKEAFEDYDLAAQEMYLDAIPKQKKMILKAPELLIVIFKPKNFVHNSKKIYDLNCLASVWCCIENILLSFAEDNLYGVTFIPQNTTRVKKVLKIPEELEVAAIIPFGYKAENARVLQQKDVDLKNKLHINQW